MDKPNSEWQTGELAKAYIEGVRGAIPGADLQFAVIEKTVELWCPDAGAILDLGCGNGVLGRFLLELFPSADGVFVDFSEPMLEAARENLDAMAHVTGTWTTAKADFSSPEWVNAVASHGPFDIIISGFAIHHQPDGRKRALYAELFDLLSPGGVFLNLEHVASATQAGVALFDDFFIDHLYAFHGRSDPEANRQAVADTYYNRPDKKENILAPVEDQCAWLRDIGFADVDCFFKVFELAIFGGRRSADPTER